METILFVNQISKSFGKTDVLKNVSFELKKGRIYGLIGANGAGKTTIMKCITGLTFPSSGEMTLFGETSNARLQSMRNRVGSMIEAPALYLHMTAYENLHLLRLLRGIPNDEMITPLLETVGLEHVGNKKAKDFSLGMKQRLGIAMALLSSPELLILDEPVNGLDPIGVVEIRQLLKKLCEERGITILISSHNLPELYQTATDYIIIHKGELVKQMTASELDEQCKQYISIRCEDSAHCVRVIEDVLKLTQYKVMPNGEIKLYEGFNELSKISTSLVQNGVALTKFNLEGDTLEDFFVSLIGGEAHV